MRRIVFYIRHSNNLASSTKLILCLMFFKVPGGMRAHLGAFTIEARVLSVFCPQEMKKFRKIRLLRAFKYLGGYCLPHGKLPFELVLGAAKANAAIASKKRSQLPHQRVTQQTSLGWACIPCNLLFGVLSLTKAF